MSPRCEFIVVQPPWLLTLSHITGVSLLHPACGSLSWGASNGVETIPVPCTQVQGWADRLKFLQKDDTTIKWCHDIGYIWFPHIYCSGLLLRKCSWPVTDCNQDSVSMKTMWQCFVHQGRLARNLRYFTMEVSLQRYPNESFHLSIIKHLVTK